MKRTAAALCLAALLACSLICPALAAGDALYPVEVTEYMEGTAPVWKRSISSPRQTTRP